MNNRFFAGSLVLLSAIATAPLPALADLKSGWSSDIAAAVDSAMAGGENARLKNILTNVVSADGNDAAAAARVATQRIAHDSTRDSEEQAKIVTADVVATMVAAAPAQTGAVLDVALTSLPPALRPAAISAAQAALSPAAGGKVLVSETTCIAQNKGLPCRTWHVPLNEAR